MSTPLTDRINLLTSQANAATGASDTTLSDAIETLIAGYGGESSSLLRSVVPSTDSKECVIEINSDWLDKYKLFAVKCHVCYTASGSEWLYYLWNTKSYSGLYYPSLSKTTAFFDTFFVFENTGSKVVFPKSNEAIRSQGAEYSVLESGNYLCIKLYANNYSDGSQFELYGMV